MENENDVKVEEQEVVEEVTTEEESTEEKQDKAVETPEARYARLKRQTEQAAKKLGLDVEKKSKPSKKSNDLDYGEKAFLIANGLKSPAERKLAEQLKAETGKDLESLVDSAYFQSELSNLREQTATEDAIPKGNGKGNQVANDSVEYWLKKGELPPVSEVKLRREVVNARLKKDESGGQFYNSK